MTSVSDCNVVKLLQQRQVFQSTSAYAIRRRIAATLSVRKIHLADIGNQRLLLDRHVVLGFSRCGRLLISYCNELDVTATMSTYTLHCWLFQGRSPLKYISKEPLFRGETVPADLHLLVCQTPPPIHTVVVGCSKTSAEDFCRPCYISVLPSFPPSTVSTQCTLHFKFDLMPPFPSFIPSLSLRIENCVVINSGDSVVALHYLLPARSAGADDVHEVFAHPPQLQEGSCSGMETYPAHAIPVDIYCKGEKLLNVQQACVQVSLDVEVWVNGELQTRLAEQGVTYHSLTDYDLQMAEVCAESGCVILILVALLEATPLCSSCPRSYYTEIRASWNVYKGTIKCFQMSRLKPALPPPLITGTRKWSPAASIALSYRQQYSLPRSVDMTVRAFSNHTVFSGKSLQCLHHTFLPISLTLLPSTYSSPMS